MISGPDGRIHGDRAFLGHPRGLGVLAFTEGWAAFSYYGMQSLLVLYLANFLLKPGHVEHVLGFPVFKTGLEHLYGPLSGQPLASAIMGLYGALAFAMPLFAGLIADRWLGRTRSITLGALLMTTGHFLMAFEVSFLLALACILCGMGLAGVMKAQVGGLYAPGDLRRADAFQIFTLFVQVAVIAAPLICGSLGEKVAWHWGFGAAGVGMLVGLAVYLWGRRWMPAEPLAFKDPKAHRPAMSAREWRTVGILVLLMPIIALSFISNSEIFNGYILWGEANFQLNFFGQTMPVSWLLSLDAIVSTVTMFASLMFWRWWASHRREPDEIVKMAFGAVFMILAPLVLAAASLQAAGGHKVGLGWGLAFHIVNDLAFSSMYPVGLALYSRAAPPALGATIVNCFSFCIFMSNLLVGYLAGFLSKMPGVLFWSLHSALIAVAAVLLLICARVFRKTLAPEVAP
jgi:POT family proton-dependent oligopeptide transporter